MAWRPLRDGEVEVREEVVAARVVELALEVDRLGLQLAHVSPDGELVCAQPRGRYAQGAVCRGRCAASEARGAPSRACRVERSGDRRGGRRGGRSGAGTGGQGGEGGRAPACGAEQQCDGARASSRAAGGVNPYGPPGAALAAARPRELGRCNAPRRTEEHLEVVVVNDRLLELCRLLVIELHFAERLPRDVLCAARRASVVSVAVGGSWLPRRARLLPRARVAEQAGRRTLELEVVPRLGGPVAFQQRTQILALGLYLSRCAVGQTVESVHLVGVCKRAHLRACDTAV